MEGKALELVLLLNVLILPVYSTLQSSSEHAIKTGGNFTLPNCNMSTEAFFISLKFSRSGSNKRQIAYKSETDDVQIKLYKDQLSLQPSGLMMLQNVSTKNRGLYTCDMDLNDDQTIQHEVQLYVGVPPVIEPFLQSNISLSEGHQLKVTCKVSGKPSPKVFWYYTNESIHRLNIKTEVVRNNTLLIRQARPSNSGLYHCYAHNRLGNARRTLRIHVREKPRVREFYHNAALDNTFYECEDIQFRCQAFESKLPVTTYHLYHNGALIINGSRNGSFTLRQIRLKDQGQYSCVPENEFEMGWNSSIEIEVLAAPDNCQKKLSSAKKITTITATTFTTGHTVTPSMPNAENASSNTGNQLYHGYIITAAVVPAFYALRTRYETF